MAIDSALGQCRIGGTALFMPVMQHLASLETYLSELAEGRLPGFQRASSSDVELAKKSESC